MTLTRVLFVDDEPLVLRALERMAHRSRDLLDATFATSGEDAVELLTQKTFDVLVTDMRMPGMSGAALLEFAQQRFPSTARIILSGYTQYETALRALPVSHRFLAKPFRAEDLQAVVLRTAELQRMLSNPVLRELVGGAKDLPSRPSVYFELRRVLSDGSSSMQAIAKLIERDAGMTGRLLRAVNNAFFAPPSRITSIFQAVQYLGTETLSGLVLSVECFSNFEDTLVDCNLVPAGLERKAYLAASIASHLVSDETQRQDAFVAGLLHDCGLLLIAARRPSLVFEAVERSRANETSLCDAERALWGVSHGEVGAYLLGLWGLPYPVVEAVAQCRTPAAHSSSTVDVGVAVYLAVAFAEAAMTGDVASVVLDEALLMRAGMQGKLPDLIRMVERTIARNASEDTHAGSSLH
jgi:HD-like signal output (HDOD) protein